jgi:PEGA domain
MRPRSFRCPALVLALACAGAPGSVARAQPPPPTAGARSMEAVKQADVLFQKGNRLYADKKWGEAEAAFAAAWALNPSFDVASNLGAAQFQLGKYRDAAEHLAFALRQWPLIGGPTRRQIALDRLRECRKHVGALGIRASTAHVEVQVDGHAVGATPLDLEVFVEPGRHVVEGRLEGYEAARQEVDATVGAGMTVTLSMVATPAVQAPVKEEAGAVVKKEEVPVPPPTMTQSSEPPTPSPGGPSKPMIITGAALAGAGVILGAVFVALSNASASDVATKRNAIVAMGASAACGATPSSACQAIQSAMHERVTFGDVAGGSFIAGGAVGAGTLIYALAAPRAAKTSGMRVAPLVALGGGGIVIQGEW